MVEPNEGGGGNIVDTSVGGGGKIDEPKLLLNCAGELAEPSN